MARSYNSQILFTHLKVKIYTNWINHHYVTLWKAIRDTLNRVCNDADNNKSMKFTYKKASNNLPLLFLSIQQHSNWFDVQYKETRNVSMLVNHNDDQNCEIVHNEINFEAYMFV